MLRPKPTMISLSMKDVAEHLESIDRKNAKARTEGAANPFSIRRPLGDLPNDNSTQANLEPPQVVYLDDRGSNIQGTAPVPISTDVLHTLDLTVRPRSSAQPTDPPAIVARSIEPLSHDSSENRTTTTTSGGSANQDFTPPGSDTQSLGFLESERSFTEEDPEFVEEEQDSMMTEVPGGSPLPRVPRPSLDYTDFGGSSRESSTFGEPEPPYQALELSPNVTPRSRRREQRLTSRTIVPEDASTPPAPGPPAALTMGSQNSAIDRLRGRQRELPRSALFNSVRQEATPMRTSTIGLAPRLTSPGTPNTLFSQPPRSTRTYRQREMTYSYEESENPDAEETPVHEDETASREYDDDDYYNEHDEYYDEREDDMNYYEEDEDESEHPTSELPQEGQEQVERDMQYHRDQILALTRRVEQAGRDVELQVQALSFHERSSHQDSEMTDDMDEPIASSPPIYFGSAGGVDGNMSRSSRTLVQNLQSAAASMESGRTGQRLPSSPSLQLPPPFSSSPRRVSDSNALPAQPMMHPSAEEDRDRGRGRRIIHRYGEIPSSMEAHAGDSPWQASPARRPDNSQNDGSPNSTRSNHSNSTALPVREGVLQDRSSPYRSRSPFPFMGSRTATRVATPYATMLPSSAPNTSSAPNSPSSEHPLHGANISPTTVSRPPSRPAPTRPSAPGEPPFVLRSDELMSSSTGGTTEGPFDSDTTFITPVRRAAAARPLPPLPAAPVFHGLTPSAPAFPQIDHATTTTSGTSRPHRMVNSNRRLDPLPRLFPRDTRGRPMTPGRDPRVTIYDDRPGAPDGQPQTIDDLPESRSRARTIVHPNTAPQARYTGQRDARGRPVTEMRVRRDRGARSDSPLGDRSRGREGLQGGFENRDERTLFDEGLRLDIIDGARRRLFVDEQDRRQETEIRTLPSRTSGESGTRWTWYADRGEMRQEQLEGGLQRHPGRHP